MARVRNWEKEKNYFTLQSWQASDKYEFRIGIYVSIHIMDNLLDFKPVNKRIYKSGTKLQY